MINNIEINDNNSIYSKNEYVKIDGYGKEITVSDISLIRKDFKDISPQNNVNTYNNSIKQKKNQQSFKEIYTQKYVGNDYLAEAVIIGDKPYFAVFRY